jgi:hypothetical protein
VVPTIDLSDPLKRFKLIAVEKDAREEKALIKDEKTGDRTWVRMDDKIEEYRISYISSAYKNVRILPPKGKSFTLQVSTAK